MTLDEVARRLDLSPATLRRWVEDGIVPLADGQWTPAAIAQARIVARLRERGHSLAELRDAARSGRLAYGYIEDILPAPVRTRTLAEAAAETGLEPRLIERIWSTAGFSAASLDAIDEEDMQLPRYMAAEVLPLASPIMDHVHQRALQHFIGQDVGGHLGFQALNEGRRPLPRIGIHAGAALYRDGDYYRRAVNLASRVGARAAAGEVLVTRPVVEAAGRHLAFAPIGEVKLKGFTDATDLFLAWAP